MIRERWSEVDITAYLDGQLTPERLSAFEHALAQDSVLQQRVDALRKTLALLREIPLRESPRNFLLTPSMVVDPKPASRKSQKSIGIMRLATSLVAAAFALTMGLNVLIRGIAPSAIMEQESLLGMQNDKLVSKQVEEPVRMVVGVTPTWETEVVQEKVFAIEEAAVELESAALQPEPEMELAPVVDLGEDETIDVDAGGDLPVASEELEGEAIQPESEMKLVPEADMEGEETTGVGGGGEPPTVPETAESLEVNEEEGVTLDTAEGEQQRTLTGEVGEEVNPSEVIPVKEDDGQVVDDLGDGEVLLTTPGEDANEIESPVDLGDAAPPDLIRYLTRLILPQWVPVFLGIMTLLLLGITLLMSTRRR